MNSLPWTDGKFVVCQDGDSYAAHIAVPDWMKGPRSLFTVYHPILFCGNGATDRNSELGNAAVYTFYDALPEGFKLCHYCARRFAQDIAPFLEGA